MTRTLYLCQHLEFVRRDIVVVVAADLRRGVKHASRKLRRQFDLTEQDYTSRALCVSIDNGSCLLAFRWDTLTGSLICHEVTHATNAMFRHIGIGFHDASCEAFAYHNDMLFRIVAKLLTDKGATIPLYQP